VKILKRASAIAFIYYLAIFLSGCFCKCDKQKYRTFACEALQLRAMEYEFTTDSTFTSHALLEDTVAAFNYGLVLNFSVTKFAVTDCSKSYSILNSAHACSCHEYTMKAKDKISRVYIRTVFDFDATHPAGSDVSTYFTILENAYLPMRLLHKPLGTLAGYADYLNEYYDYLEVPIYLNASPESLRKVQFKIDVALENGNTISALSDEVFIR